MYLCADRSETSAVFSTLKPCASKVRWSTRSSVVAEASALPGCNILPPFAGCALAEILDGARAGIPLVIYDDLSTHARTYRELSLLREAAAGSLSRRHFFCPFPIAGTLHLFEMPENGAAA